MQDTDGLMFQKTQAGEYIYYGPNKGEINGYKWAGDVLPQGSDVEWTQTLSDNPSAKIDFSALANSADARTLSVSYTHLLRRKRLQIIFQSCAM